MPIRVLDEHMTPAAYLAALLQGYPENHVERIPELLQRDADVLERCGLAPAAISRLPLRDQLIVYLEALGELAMTMGVTTRMLAAHLDLFNGSTAELDAWRQRLDETRRRGCFAQGLSCAHIPPPPPLPPPGPSPLAHMHAYSDVFAGGSTRYQVGIIAPADSFAAAEALPDDDPPVLWSRELRLQLWEAAPAAVAEGGFATPEVLRAYQMAGPAARGLGWTGKGGGAVELLILRRETIEAHSLQRMSEPAGAANSDGKSYGDVFAELPDGPCETTVIGVGEPSAARFPVAAPVPLHSGDRLGVRVRRRKGTFARGPFALALTLRPLPLYPGTL